MAAMRGAFGPARDPGELFELGSAAARWAVIAAVVAICLACLSLPVARGGPPEVFLPIFLCFSAAYVVAGAIGWMVRPANSTGPLLLAIGLAGSLILLGASGLPWIGIVTQASATTATVLLSEGATSSPSRLPMTASATPIPAEGAASTASSTGWRPSTGRSRSTARAVRAPA
jgi:hypothetical protein